MLVKYHRIVPADCTSDPHPVSYGDLGGEEMLQTMLADIVRVCESDMVMHVECVCVAFDEEKFESDYYVTSNFGGKQKLAKGAMAKKHKTDGLFLYSDAEVDGQHHLPPGLTGVKEAAKLINKKPKAFESLRIGVTWAFAGNSSCSDYIEINGENTPDETYVNFGSQDWWINKEGYVPWCDEMEAFLRREFPRDGDS